MPLSLEDYCVGTPRRFGIIYFDACGPLPSQGQKTTRVLASILRHSALAPLGVLVSNFSKPDTSKPDKLERYAYLTASYLFPKSFLDTEDGGVTNSAQEHDFSLHGGNGTASFLKEVEENFDHYYGSFITRQLIDIATLIAPMVRLVDSGLYKQLFDSDLKKAVDRAHRFVKFNPAAPDDESDESGLHSDGDAVVDSSMQSILWTHAACGCYPTDSNFNPPPQAIKGFLESWIEQLRGLPGGKPPIGEIVAAYYAWRDDPKLWSEAMKPLAEYPYKDRMLFLCDVPTEEIGFYPAIAQLAFPTHCNVREAKRFKYVAEGKTTAMFLDALAFDECRYDYDWLSALHLVPDDWNDVSAELVFRFALDAIAKERRWYGDDFLYGCHVMGTNEDNFDASELARRETRLAATETAPIEHGSTIADLEESGLPRK